MSEDNKIIAKQLTLMVVALFVAFVVRDFVRLERKVKDQLVISDVEAFLKVARLSKLILESDEAYLKAVELSWLNESYSGPTKALRLDEWIKQTQTATLSP